MNDFSDNIKKYRKKNNLSQADLAEKLYLTSQAISKWERGVSEPDLKFLCKLARIFNVTTDELLGMYDTDKPGNFMIGIDGGGTKTEMILFSSDGKIINRVMLDGSNPNSCSIEATFLTLKKRN